jgi:hypothetical protein
MITKKTSAAAGFCDAMYQEEKTVKCNCNVCWLIRRLEDAGKTSIAMPESGFSPAMKLKKYPYIREKWKDQAALPWTRVNPTSWDIKLMDEAFDWLLIIPDTELKVRKVVQARMYIHPVNERYLYSWRRIGKEMSVHHEQVQRWHKKGIKIILAGVAKHATNQ